MRTSTLSLGCLVVTAITSHVLADTSIDIVEQFDSTRIVEKWMVNQGATVEWVADTDQSGWMQLKIARYDGQGNAWPAASRATGDINMLEAVGIGFTIHNPDDRAQAIQISLGQTDGQTASDLFTIAPHTTQRLVSRFDAMSATVNPGRVESISLYRTQPSFDQRLLVKDIFLVRGVASSTSLGQLRELHKQLTQAILACKADKLLPPDRIAYLTGLVKEWAAPLRMSDGLEGRVNECRAALAPALAEAKSAMLRSQYKQSIVTWPGSVGRSLFPQDAIVELSDPLEILEIDVLNGAYSQGIVRLTNIDDKPADLLVEWRSIDNWTRSHVELWRTGNVLATDSAVVADALIPLDSVGFISIAPGETTELWVRLDARREAWPEGTHEASLRMRNLRQPDADLELPVMIHATGIDLPPKAPLHLLTWPELFISRSNVVRGIEDQAAKNLADYGADVLTLVESELPWPKLNERGELIEAIDFSAFDERVTFYFEHIPDALFLCWLRFDIPDPNGNYELRSGLTPGTEAWRRGALSWLKQWRAHIESQGWSPSRFGFYLADEPGTDELDRYLAFAPLIRETAPDMPIYVDTSELYNDPAKSAQLLGLLDIVQPDATLGFERNPTMVSELRNQDQIDLWVYACRTGRRGRTINIHEYYRLQVWQAMRDGLGGIGFWTYSAAHGDPNELWNGTAAPGAGATLVYRGDNRLIMSRRWELIRESLDDARLLQAISNLKTPEADALLAQGFASVLDNPTDPTTVIHWRQQAIALLRR